MALQTKSITLGDLLQRVALGVHRELEDSRMTMRGMDPELRTKFLRAFISRTLKKFAQIYAICDYLKGPTARQFFSSLNELKRQISTIETQLCETQDQLYWKHAQLFPMRSRPFEVVPAMDLLATGSYPHLPSVIFSCGRFPAPGKKLDKFALVKDLDIFIRAKLALNDPLPHGVDEATVSNGTLRMRQSDVYEVYATLTQLTEDAPWIVLDSNILARSRASESFDGGYDVDTLNWELGSILVNRCKAVIPEFAPGSASISDPTAASVEQGANEVKMAVDGGGEAAAVSSAITPAFVTEAKVSSNVSNREAQFTLTHVHAICRYVGLSALHRLLYAQASELSRTLWRGSLDVVFYEDVDSFQLRAALWRSAHTGAFQVELRVTQDRDPVKRIISPAAAGAVGTGAGGPESSSPHVTADEATALRVSLYMLSNEMSRDRQLVTRHPVSDAAEAIDLSSLALSGGASFTPLLDHSIFLLALCKLKFMYARISVTACIGPGAQVPALRSLQAVLGPASLSIERTNPAASGRSKKRSILMLVHIDARSGEFAVKVSGATGGATKAASKLQSLLLKELNAVDVHQDLSHLLADKGVPLIGGAATSQGPQQPGLAVFSKTEHFEWLQTGPRVGLAADRVRPLDNLQAFLLEITSEAPPGPRH